MSSTSKQKLTPSFDLIASAWKLYKRGFFHFIGMYLWGLLGLLPLAVVAGLAISLYTFADWQTPFFYVLFGFVGLLALAWAIYFTTRAKIGWLMLIKNDFKGIRPTFNETKPYFWRYLWASLVVGLITFVLIFFLLVPAIYVAVIFAFALIAIVFEDKRTFSSIERSYDLVKSYWWPVFGRFILIGFLALIASFFLNIPLAFLEGALRDIWMALVNIFWALTGPFFLVYSYQLYLDLKAKN
ncbi:hypothetical protein CVU83_01585 [Candidatus Falkowbacteria bacterium HGW-Falkowbacteria-2]|uniref:DUF7847 domain-containing protein n=1 Tax=Candidatus Falkowbacteria bacterium HGW-Falkowbacteria-2 TaxID=2013769 RepID=A0A2N2E1F9_9BACT|nr:MAG: hypothetical protein CVU83_01585 [Candidatus Falkowbacteria bacterium HGW-Falkowbacteria-2]